MSTMAEHEHVYEQDLGILDFGRWHRWGCTCGAFADVAREPTADPFKDRAPG